MVNSKLIKSIAIYARSDQPDAANILRQYTLAQRTAENRFGESATVAYCDDGMAASTMRRPALQAMLLHLDAGFVRAIIVAHSDRLTRSYMDDLRLRLLFQAAGVPLIVADDPPQTLEGPSPEVVGEKPAPIATRSRWVTSALCGLLKRD